MLMKTQALRAQANEACVPGDPHASDVDDSRPFDRLTSPASYLPRPPTP